MDDKKIESGYINIIASGVARNIHKVGIRTPGKEDLTESFCPDFHCAFEPYSCSGVYRVPSKED